jgi:hypothetical protein
VKYFTPVSGSDWVTAVRFAAGKHGGRQLGNAEKKKGMTMAGWAWWHRV